jgi:uncharacterized protein (TIGR03083 family)
MIPTATIDMLQQIFTSVTTLCAGLTDDEWKLPTDLAGWSVQDNLAHLIGTERMLQGLPAAPAVDEVGGHVKNPIGMFNEAEIECRRSRTGAEVLAEWQDLVTLRLATLHGADEAYFAQPMSTPTGPGTMADFLHIRILDSWLHEQDIRRAVAQPGHQGGPAAEHTIDRLLRTVPIVVGKRAATPEGGAVVIDITGDVSRHVACEVAGGRAAMVTQPTHAPLAAITLDAEAFVILATGRRPATDLAGRIAISGDADLAQRVVDNLNMMI